MSGDSGAPTKDGSGSLVDPAAGRQSQPSEEAKSSPIPSMSGALQDEGTKESTKSAEGPKVTDPTQSPAESENKAENLATEKDSEAIPAGTNGTPSASKKTSNGKRKSTGGVPEHKTKKPTKKKSMSKITYLDAQPGEYYFARLKSYPPWPAVICDEGMLPHSLLSTRPVTTKQADGTYKETYADGGKRVHERTFPIMFLHTNEFAWLPNTELSKLDPEDCKDVSEKGKSKSLIQAYHVAAEGHGLEHFKEMLLEHQQAMQEDQERKEAREVAKAEKGGRADKKKRKSEVAEEEDDDMDMDEDEDEGKSQPRKSSKKRKKEIESDGEDEKPAKTPKTATKLKLTTPKAPVSREKKGKDANKTPKSKSTRKKPKAAASDEDIAEEAAKEIEKPLDPAEAKAKKAKEVLFLRHKLQKGFLSRDQAPQESEMPAMSSFIAKLENYADLEVSIIRSTKINKVLKALIKLNSIPKDEELHFKSRSIDLLGRWNKTLGAESATDEHAGPSGADKEEPPTTNGVHAGDQKSGEEQTEDPASPTDGAAGDETMGDASAESKDAAVDDKIVEDGASSTAAADQAEETMEEAEPEKEPTPA